MNLRTESAAAGAAILLVTSLGLGAQQMRDTTVAPVAAGAASIVGQVVTGDAQPRPVRRAMVTISGSRIADARTAGTDDQGRFVLTGLPGGTYTLRAFKSGYVTGYFGARHPERGPALPFTIGDAERKTGVTVTMLRGAVIAGTVYDMNGRPEPGARVSAMQFRMINGERVLVNVSASGNLPLGMTDDRGAYRLWGLPPGSFILSVNPTGSPFTLGARLITDADLQWASQQIQQGASAISPGPRSASISRAPDAGRAVAYAPVYYPGAVDPLEATAITVAAGEERDGADITLQLITTARVDGTVVGPDGRPAPRAQVVLTVDREDQAGVTTSNRAADAEGHFSFPSVTPGHYTLSARGGPQVIDGLVFFSPSGGGAAPPPPPPPPRAGASDQGLWAQDEVSVSGEDITNLTLALRPGMTVSGKVAFDGPSKPPTDLTRVRIGLSSTGITSGLPSNIPPRAVAPDGTFSLTGVAPGRYRVNWSMGPPAEGGSAASARWSLTSALSGGRDVLDSWLEVQPGQDVPDVTAVFDDRQTELSGAMIDTAGQPVPGYIVIVFPVDRTLWGSSSRRTRQSPANATGRFEFAGLPPGDYYLGAVTDLDPTDLSDPSFLEEVASVATRFSLSAGEKKTQDVRIRK